MFRFLSDFTIHKTEKTREKQTNTTCLHDDLIPQDQDHTFIDCFFFIFVGCTVTLSKNKQLKLNQDPWKSNKNKTSG